MLFPISLSWWCFLQLLSPHTYGWHQERFGATTEMSLQVRLRGSVLELSLTLLRSGGHRSGKILSSLFRIKYTDLVQLHNPPTFLCSLCSRAAGFETPIFLHDLTFAQLTLSSQRIAGCHELAGERDSSAATLPARHAAPLSLGLGPHHAKQDLSPGTSWGLEQHNTRICLCPALPEEPYQGPYKGSQWLWALPHP